MEKSDLPSENWSHAFGDDVFEFVTSGSRGWAQFYSSEGASFIRVGNLDHGTIKLDLRDVQKVLAPDGAEGERTKLRTNDVLISITAEIGMIGVVPSGLGNAYINQHIALARPRECFDHRYIAWYLASEADGKRRLLEKSRGGTKSGLGLDDIRNIDIPIAPRHEQTRIADKLDTVLTRVDACRDRLARVAPLLKRFRQSVLAAATSGRLTEDWRRTNAVELPWTTCATKEAGHIQLGRQRSPKYHSGSNMRPYLRVQNVFEDRLDFSDVMTMVFDAADFERYRLKVGDILLNEGQSPEYLGRPAMFRGELPDVCFTNTLIRFQAFDYVHPDFALLVFRHYMHSGRYIKEGTTTTNIAHLGAGRFGEVEFPLPSLGEQKEIDRRAKQLFSFADRLEARLKTAQTAADRLTPALLAKAFRGELVPQDPNDEPAAELLKRLAASRDAAPKAKRGRRSSATA